MLRLWDGESLERSRLQGNESAQHGNENQEAQDRANDELTPLKLTQVRLRKLVERPIMLVA